MNMNVNLADLCDAIAGALPDRCALVCDGERRSYPELMARSNQVAQVLAQAGVTPDETVGLYLFNSVAHIEALLGCMVARAIPVNINYRYTGAELAHLFAGGRLAALIVDAEHVALAAEVASSCPSLRTVLVTGTGEDYSALFGPAVSVAGFENAVAAAPAQRPDNGRSGDDKLIIYTGGTTGLPKGVLWRHEDFYFAALAGGNHYGPPRLSVAEVVAAAAEVPSAGYVITAPMMHGAGTYTLFSAFLLGSKVVLSRRFDAAQTLRLVAAERAMALAVVGDAMARPLWTSWPAIPANTICPRFSSSAPVARCSRPACGRSFSSSTRTCTSPTGSAPPRPAPTASLIAARTAGSGSGTAATSRCSTTRCARCRQGGPAGSPSPATYRWDTWATTRPRAPRSRS